jgi:hypothetical protein
MKAEERALEAYPKETRDIGGIVVDIGHPQYIRDFYIEGYRQAEKDLELTWEDVSKIRQIMFDYNRQLRPKIVENKASFPKDKEYCREVLNRFKKGKG